MFIVAEWIFREYATAAKKALVSLSWILSASFRAYLFTHYLLVKSIHLSVGISFWLFFCIPFCLVLPSACSLGCLKPSPSESSKEPLHPPTYPTSCSLSSSLKNKTKTQNKKKSIKPLTKTKQTKKSLPNYGVYFALNRIHGHGLLWTTAGIATTLHWRKLIFILPAGSNFK